MLLQGFLQQLATRPQSPCLVEGERRLSYQEVARRAGGIARQLQALTLPRERPIAVALPRGIDATCAVLGILASGRCYLPLDPKAPDKRRQWIVADAKAAAVIGRDPLGDLSVPWIEIDSISPAPLDPVPQDVEALAGVLYTSGSTGTPKGVALSHRAIFAFSNWAKTLVDLNPDDRIAAIAPLHFDLSTFDLFSALSAGAVVDFLPEGLTMAPSRLSTWLAERTVTGFYTVPSLLAFWVWKGNLSAIRLSGLRFLLFAGEPFPTVRLRQMAKTLLHVQLHNLYGPTETNVCCHWKVRQERLIDDQAIPIGHPACGDRLQIDPASGELWVRGPTLSSGYWQQGKLHSHLNDQGWYPTGDRVSLNGQGEYVYLGRLDRMLKVSGHRVEPAEIEAALQTLPQVVECAVVGIEDWDSTRPAAALVLQEELSLHRIRGHLKRMLPPYMLPARILTMANLPRLSNGKPDLTSIQKLLCGTTP